MRNVRKMAATTVSLIILVIGVGLLTRWCKTHPGRFLFAMQSLLSYRFRFGDLQNTLIRISFWLMLIASGSMAIFHQESGINVVKSFGTPIIFTLLNAGWACVAMYRSVNTIWFWLFYQILLIICIKASYGKLCALNGIVPSSLKAILKNRPSRTGKSRLSIVDQSVIYVMVIVMVVDRFALLASLVVFFIQYKQAFGL